MVLKQIQHSRAPVMSAKNHLGHIIHLTKRRN